MHVLARSPSEEIASTSLWAVLLRSWLRVLVVSGLVGALTFGVLSLTQQYYAATIRVDAGSATAVATVVRSPEIVETLAAELELANIPAFNSSLVPDGFAERLLRTVGIGKPRPGETVEQAVLAAVQRNLRVYQGRAADGVTIEFTSPSPELSSQAVSRLAALYQASIGGKAAPATVADGALAREIEALKRDVAAADAAVAQARNTTGATRQALNVGTGNPEIADLAESVALARRARDDAEARTRSVRALIEKGRVEAIPDVQPSPLLHELIADRVRVEVQKTTAERSLPAGHPRIAELQTQHSEIRWRMYREATSLVDELEKAAATAKMREAEARARLEKARANAPEDTDAAERLAALEADAAAKRVALEDLQALAGGDSATSSTAGIVSAPRASGIPVSPRKGQLALLAAVSTLMIGFVVVIIRELVVGMRRPPIETEFADLAAAARDRATIRIEPAARDITDSEPREHVLSKGYASADRPVANPDAGHFAILSSTDDAARHIAAVAAERRGYRTLLVGDGIDGAGEARDFASALAASGRRCVVIDWSPSGKGIAATLGLPGQPGINDLLGGRATFDDVIMRMPDSEVHIIASGSPVAGKTPLDPDWIGLVLDALDETYDHVIVAARLDAARALFEATEGRFDAGVVMSERRTQGTSINAAPGVFLGFEVTEIYVVQMDLAQRNVMPARRLKRAKRQALA